MINHDLIISWKR